MTADRTMRRMTGKSSLTEAARHRIELGIADADAEYRTRERWEAFASIAIGLAIIPALYFGLVWFVGLLFRLATHQQFAYGGAFSPWVLSIGILWFGFGGLLAWRRVHPFSAVEPLPGKPYDPYLDPPPVRLADADDERVEGRLRGILAIAASGPANILEGIAQLRDLPAIDDAMIARAAEFLAAAASKEGLTERTLRRDALGARAMAHLFRLKLILRDGTFSQRWRIRATSKGRALVA